MKESRAKGILLAALLWCVILAVLGAGYKFLVHPRLTKKLQGQTGSSSQYEHQVVIAADSFSGYCVLRSELFRQQLKSQRIRLTVQDDKADYEARLKALRDGEVQMAVFTIDSLLTAGAKLGDVPATIVLVLDETKGADAMVAYKAGVGQLQDLDGPDVRLVLTPNSPSEFLARVVIAHINLPSLPRKWWVEADGAADVYRQFINAEPSAKRAYVLWEPYVSKALQQPGAHLLINSSELKGLVVDVLVARRQFLVNSPTLARHVIESYLRALYGYSQQKDGLLRLVIDDAKQAGSEKLTHEQAEKLANGILWKNTLENYAHFGLLEASDAGGLPHVEDMIGRITDVLIKTDAIERDPLDGQVSALFYKQILADMKADQFHPGKTLNIIQGAGGPGLDPVRSELELARLTDAQWDALLPVGEWRITPLGFGRANAAINLQSQRDLQELAAKLQFFPRYYLQVVGHARAEGDPAANLKLAEDRAAAAAQYLITLGVSQNRIKAEAAQTRGTGGEAQAVSFRVGQLAY